MPSIRVRQYNSYATLYEEPDTVLVSRRSTASGSFAGPPTPRESTVGSPRTRPSLAVVKSREIQKFRPRSSTSLSRIQSRVFRDSIPNYRASTYHGHSSTRVGDFLESPKLPHRLPIPLQSGVSPPQYPGRTNDSDYAAVEEGWIELHHGDIVEHLDVIDPQVGAVSTLTNAANSIVIPPTPFYDRKPVITLPASPQDEVESGSMYGDALDRHVDDVIRHPFPIRRALRGVWTFLKTPMGIIIGIYGFLVVFWGAAIVIFLARIINFHNEDLQGFWIEVSSQVVNGLFTVTGIGLIPSRVIATYRIYKIWHYKRKTIRLRKLAGIPQLLDVDDLPDPCYDDNYVRVLTDEEQKDLHRQQAKLQYHQTWYRAHGSETHRAFPINIALAICILSDGNSIFQIMLCGTMWGLNRFKRPAWSTATLISASFLCGIGAAILIWRGGVRTKRVEEIRQKLRDALAEIPTTTNEDSHLPQLQPCSVQEADPNSPVDRPEPAEVMNSSSEKLTNPRMTSVPRP